MNRNSIDGRKTLGYWFHYGRGWEETENLPRAIDAVDEVSGPTWLVTERRAVNPRGHLVSRSVSARRQSQGARLGSV